LHGQHRVEAGGLARRHDAEKQAGALSRPISGRRWVTTTSITFMIRMPATTRLMAAMPLMP